jgi:hypothetical protein
MMVNEPLSDRCSVMNSDKETKRMSFRIDTPRENKCIHEFHIIGSGGNLMEKSLQFTNKYIVLWTMGFIFQPLKSKILHLKFLPNICSSQNTIEFAL